MPGNSRLTAQGETSGPLELTLSHSLRQSVIFRLALKTYETKKCKLVTFRADHELSLFRRCLI
jgi:hypothetical protein